jgi:hypothetical protein
MKKLFVVSLLFAFFLINSVNLFANTQDFYGTWIGEYSEDGEVVRMNFLIDKSILAIEIVYIIDDEILGQEEFSIEIIDWEEIVNTDNNTKNNYPNGYSLELNAPLGSTFLEIYISRDKKQLIIPNFNEETDETMFFVRQ